jgi:hypothetical protein
LEEKFKSGKYNLSKGKTWWFYENLNILDQP